MDRLVIGTGRFSLGSLVALGKAVSIYAWFASLSESASSLDLTTASMSLHRYTVIVTVSCIIPQTTNLGEVRHTRDSLDLRRREHKQKRKAGLNTFNLSYQSSRFTIHDLDRLTTVNLRAASWIFPRTDDTHDCLKMTIYQKVMSHYSTAIRSWMKQSASHVQTGVARAFQKDVATGFRERCTLERRVSYQSEREIHEVNGGTGLF